jgi:acyl-CoA synthetase (AMP-forming)/AMP-acid ligase II
VENALYADKRVLEVAAVGVPDKRLGELPAVVVTLKKGHYGTVTEVELMKFAAQRYLLLL